MTAIIIVWPFDLTFARPMRPAGEEFRNRSQAKRYILTNLAVKKWDSKKCQYDTAAILFMQFVLLKRTELGHPIEKGNCASRK